MSFCLKFMYTCNIVFFGQIKSNGANQEEKGVKGHIKPRDHEVLIPRD